MDKNGRGKFLAATSLFGFLGVMAFLCFGEVKAANKDFFNMALMALIGWVGIGIGYFLGSSDGSAKKNAVINTAITKGVTDEKVSES